MPDRLEKDCVGEEIIEGATKLRLACVGPMYCREP